MPLKVGVLALHGDVSEHEDALLREAKPMNLELVVSRVKYSEDLKDLDGLVIPGGESTVMHYLAKETGLLDGLKNFVKANIPVLGTCAGLIMLADRIEGQDPIIGGLDIEVGRNAYGRQMESFKTGEIVAPGKSDTSQGIFIRAPSIKSTGKSIVLAFLKDQPVGVQQDNIVGLTFHPELNSHSAWHKYFLQLVMRFKEESN